MKKSLLLLLACLFSAIAMAESRQIAKPSFGPAFNVEITPLPEDKDFRGFAIRFPSAIATPDYPINSTVLGEIYLPVNAQPDHQRPAVQIFHTIGPDKFQLEKKICQLLAKDGIVAAYFQMPYFRDDDSVRLWIRQGDYDRLQQAKAEGSDERRRIKVYRMDVYESYMNTGWQRFMAQHPHGPGGCFALGALSGILSLILLIKKVFYS
ncbi:MAG: hypothetical protein J6T06_00970 [Victivallales bacterium]|nr:hypothetical protein [Victivallales bacterium]